MPLRLDDVGEHDPVIRAKALPGERRAALRAAAALRQHHLRLPPHLSRTQDLHRRDGEFSVQGGLSPAQKALEESVSLMKAAAPDRWPHKPPSIQIASSTPCPPQPRRLSPASSYQQTTGSAIPLPVPPAPRSPGANTLPGRPQLPRCRASYSLSHPARHGGDFHPQLSPSLILLKSAKVQLNVWSLNVQFLSISPFKWRAASVPRSHLLAPL